MIQFDEYFSIGLKPPPRYVAFRSFLFQVFLAWLLVTGWFWAYGPMHLHAGSANGNSSGMGSRGDHLRVHQRLQHPCSDDTSSSSATSGVNSHPEKLEGGLALSGAFHVMELGLVEEWLGHGLIVAWTAHTEYPVEAMTVQLAELISKVQEDPANSAAANALAESQRAILKGLVKWEAAVDLYVKTYRLCYVYDLIPLALLQHHLILLAFSWITFISWITFMAKLFQLAYTPENSHSPEKWRVGKLLYYIYYGKVTVQVLCSFSGVATP